MEGGEMRTGNEVQRRKLRSAWWKLLTGGETGPPEALQREKKKQKTVKSRRIWLLPAALGNGYVGNLVKISSKQDPRPAGVGKREDPKTAARSSLSVFGRKLWGPICNWFTLKSSDKRGTQPKPTIVEIGGHGTMVGVLDDIIGRKPSAEGRPRSGRELQSRDANKSARMSPWHRSGVYHPAATLQGERCLDRDVSVSSAILYCKRSYLKEKT